MIKVCCCCSKVDVDQLKKVVPEDKLEVGCIDQCQGVDGKAFGLVNDELVSAENSEAFIELVKISL